MRQSTIRSKIKSGRWRQVRLGVYSTFTGPITRRGKLWAAVLYADPTLGQGGNPDETNMRARLSHQSAAEVDNLLDERSDIIHLTISATRRIRPTPGIRVHRTRNLRDLRFPPGELPRTWVEDTLLDLADATEDIDQVCALVTAAFGRKLTSAAIMRTVLAERHFHRWRREISELITAADGGAHSVLESRYDQDVERAHGLPLSQHQVPFRKKDGGRGFRDRVYSEFNVIVELDGRLAHPADRQWEDKERDNAAAEGDQQSLRYGWRHVYQDSCQTAIQVANVLRARGWKGQPRPCSGSCPVRKTVSPEPGRAR
ncbi:MAG: hypothetical protein FWE35_01680 [Streptosporangiales bacterium]|nr:hypothetical protein [Streptosporangiales bacterium]